MESSKVINYQWASHCKSVCDVSACGFWRADDFHYLAATNSKVPRHWVFTLNFRQLWFFRSVPLQQFCFLSILEDWVLWNELMVGDVDQQLFLEEHLNHEGAVSINALQMLSKLDLPFLRLGLSLPSQSELHSRAPGCWGACCLNCTGAWSWQLC